ncbi:MAG: PhzF family phenazine biosynthesis protein [Chloroflexota bacterium]|nr:PhzF family phenazine biosynthesis protein [Chloroflexota bacterium]
MVPIRFYQVDVFCDRPFGGNPLAVFPDAAGLTRKEMQQLALELNLSETTFVFPPDSAQADFKVRIFTPVAEIPFAGHPLVGTHWVLADLGRVPLEEPTTTVTFELGVGLRSGHLHVRSGEVDRVVTAHQAPQFRATATQSQARRLAQALQIPFHAIVDTGKPVQVVSTGYPQLFVPVNSLAIVSGIDVLQIDAAELGKVCCEMGLEGADVAVFSLETMYEDRDVHMRFFAPHHGILEDPATGSASGGMASYLVHHQLVSASPPVTTIVTEQGIEMKRPSKVTIEIEGSPEEISMVWVSGDVVPVMSGVFFWRE